MPSVILAQAEADILIAMEKHRVDGKLYPFPKRGGSISLDIKSFDEQEEFKIDLNRGRISLKKVTMQTRGRRTIVLVRLDLEGAPHRNPDGEEIKTPHLHLYREGYGDKWAIPVPQEQFSDVSDLNGTLEDFMRYCNIVRPPRIDMELFE